MATFTIDGKEIEILPGKNVLKTALDNGIYIPHYCYHPGLSIPGNCRMCMVEIEAGGRRGLLCAVVAPAGQGPVFFYGAGIVPPRRELPKRPGRRPRRALVVFAPTHRLAVLCQPAGVCAASADAGQFHPRRGRAAPRRLAPAGDLLFTIQGAGVLAAGADMLPHPGRALAHEHGVTVIVRQVGNEPEHSRDRYETKLGEIHDPTPDKLNEGQT